MSNERCFEKFLHNIEPSKTTKEYISSIQRNLRLFLEEHEFYKYKVVDTFLSGSYAKHTCIRPTKYDGKTDVDIVVVTNYTENDDSKIVLNELYKICKEKYRKVTKQKRSIGIEMSGIEVDVVPMIVDKICMAYKIGDKKDGKWHKTNPKEHIRWCSNTNKNNYDKFAKVVKIFKWWRKNNCPDTIKYPKGITLEKIIADNLADCNDTYEMIVYNTLKNIKFAFKGYIESESIPFVSDPAIQGNNLLDSYNFEDIKSFYNKINRHLELLDASNFSNDCWHKLLGMDFPKLFDNRNEVGFASEALFFNVPYKSIPRWLEWNKAPLVDVYVKCYDQQGNFFCYDPDGNYFLNKNLSIDFTVVGAAAFSADTSIYWQVVNTGTEAKENNCLRGGFEKPNIQNLGRRETTEYSGTHWVQAFVINNNRCIAKSKEILVKIK